jgi:hypothetical protein
VIFLYDEIPVGKGFFLPCFLEVPDKGEMWCLGDFPSCVVFLKVPVKGEMWFPL